MDTKTSKDKLSNNTKILISRRDTLRTKQQLLDQEKTELKELRKTIKLEIRKDINKFNETIARDTIRQTKSIRKTKSLLNSQQEWIISLKSQNASNITNRKELNENATKFLEKLFSSTKKILKT